MRLLTEVQKLNFQLPVGKRGASVQILALTAKGKGEEENRSLCSSEDINKFLAEQRAPLRRMRLEHLQQLLSVDEQRAEELLKLQEKSEKTKSHFPWKKSC